MKGKGFVLLLIIMAVSVHGFAQRALPGFTLKQVGQGKVSISWINPFPQCSQLAVQRSTDGVNFRTIFSAQSPELPSNGYVDNKVPAGVTVYYRIFYVLNGSAWYFSDKKSPGEITADDQSERIQITDPVVIKDSAVIPTIQITGGPKQETRILSTTEYKRFRDSILQNTKDTLQLLRQGEVRWKPFIPKPKDYVSVFVKDTLLVQIELPFYKRFKDSVLSQTKDTLYNITTFRAELKRYIPKVIWKPSVYVYTNSNGYLNLSLPNASKEHYKLIIFDNDGKEIFSIAHIRESELVLDKGNFKKAGWYQFELFRNNSLLEKSKFYLPKN